MRGHQRGSVTLGILAAGRYSGACFQRGCLRRSRCWRVLFMIRPPPDKLVHLTVKPVSRPLEEQSDQGQNGEYTGDKGYDSERVKKSLHYCSLHFTLCSLPKARIISIRSVISALFIR